MLVHRLTCILMDSLIGPDVCKYCLLSVVIP